MLNIYLGYYPLTQVTYLRKEQSMLILNFSSTNLGTLNKERNPENT